MYDQNELPQGGALNRGINLTADSNRMEALVVGAGFMDFDPWGMPHRLVMGKLQIKQGSGAPTDVPAVLKIVEALFPKGAPIESYLRDVTLDVPLSQISELKLTAKKLEPGKVKSRQRSPEGYYSIESPTYSRPIQHMSVKRPFPETVETPEIGSHTEGQKQGS